jgi:16S rRNA (cytosine1402-N4)-methyltransferase
MTREVIAALSPKSGEVVVDATYGAGGHSRALKATAKIKLISIDADPANIQHSSGQTGEEVIEGNFGDLDSILEGLGVERVDKVLFDLGWQSGQLDSGRGFSFMHDEPLNMSYGPNPRSGFTAAQVLNNWSEKALADVLFGYAEERYAKRIAKKIVERRAIKPFETTVELAEVVRDAVPARYRHGKSNPATKTFQALRIAVNDELGVLREGLGAAWRRLACNGRIAVITFHSIEDRIVKQNFAKHVKAGHGRLLYKKPLTPSVAEVEANRAARSAKLRVIEKLC